MRFEFATATRIIFGAGTLRELCPLAKNIRGRMLTVAPAGDVRQWKLPAEFARRALVVTGHNPGRAEPLLGMLRENGLEGIPFAVTGEPEIETVRAGVKLARSEDCGFVIGFGGGSAIDAGKAIAAMLRNEGDVLDYLEIIGHGKSLTRLSAPLFTVPTTAGTGAEVTRNAVLASPEHRVKVSLRSALMLPRVALIDPELAYDLPPEITAYTGLDALTQLIEPYVCTRANPLTDALCVEGLRRAARSLRRACDNGRDVSAREDMAAASLFGGMALANAGLGAVHGFAGPIGGMFSAPHGALCAALLPHVMETNLRALRQREPASEILPRYDKIARLLTGNPVAKADDGAEWVRALITDLRIPSLGCYGLGREHTAELVEKSAKASSMKANPIVLTTAELVATLEAAL